MDTTIVILLVCSGLLVGVINTFAGAAAAITMALFTALGLPINVANGTNRIPVLAQTLVMSIGFARQGYLDLSAGFRLAIPTICGAVFGSLYATHVNPTIFQYLLCTILIILLCVLLFNPQRFMRNESLGNRKVRLADYFWFLLIGLYGGFFHIGIGYLILTATIVGMGYNLMQANALKGFIVLSYIPFSLVVFIARGQVDFVYGLIHAAGNLVGAGVATYFASKIPLGLIRWSLVVMIFFTILDIFKIISLQHTLENIFNLTLR